MPNVIDWSNRFNFGGPRTQPIQGICVHTTENAPGTPASNVAQYQIDSETGSYHRLVDYTSTILIENTDDWTTWSTGNKGNDVLLHVSCVARAAMTRAQWLAQPDMLKGVAYVMATWSKAYGIPLVKRSPQDLVNGVRGVYSHDDTRIWGGTDHTDPGPGFPYDVVFDLANQINGGKPAPSEGTKAMELTGVSAAALDEAKRYARDAKAQLTGSPALGEYPGFAQLGNRTVVDALAAIGEKLGINGFKAP